MKFEWPRQSHRNAETPADPQLASYFLEQTAGIIADTMLSRLRYHASGDTESAWDDVDDVFADAQKPYGDVNKKEAIALARKIVEQRLKSGILN